MGPKDEIPWKIRASILYSVRAHPDALRCIAVCHDESTFFTGGVGPGFKGTIQKWELQRANCISSYYGHDEVVNHILILSASGRVASCGGTIHVWNSHSGKLISAYAEQTNNYSQSSTRTVYKGNMDPDNLSGGILSSAFNGNLYTCMHYLETENKLIAGMGNGSLRFIDIVHDRKLHICKSDGGEHTLSSLVSAICSCGSEKLREERGASSSSWIAAGLSSGHCRLLDARSGDVIALWRAHDAHITRHSGEDLGMIPMARNLSSQTNVFRGHKDGISSFDVWGQDDGLHQLLPQKLYSVDRRNLSVLSCIKPNVKKNRLACENGRPEAPPPTMVAQVVSWQRHLDIIVSALSGPCSLGEGQFHRAKKALAELMELWWGCSMRRTPLTVESTLQRWSISFNGDDRKAKRRGGRYE
ncbi:hypothetical protein QJS10_CPB17g00908 [Acorus calamus]|uniref:Uncharacterized protein n=1 Tax=Acorus calamus TaxID=4465 RepID=A0AAV9CSG3_ACOCL|nr:hypothetical protein QJS10_CPB17g00908 [Acorus calamus]